MSMSIFMLIPRKLQSKFYKTKKACGKHAIRQREVAEINSMRISRKRLLIVLGVFGFADGFGKLPCTRSVLKSALHVA